MKTLPAADGDIRALNMLDGTPVVVDEFSSGILEYADIDGPVQLGDHMALALTLTGDGDDAMFDYYS